MFAKEKFSAEILEAGLDDFRVCLCEVWAHLKHPVPTPLQLDIAWHLQHGGKKIVIQAFRGVGKSWITVVFALWCLLIDPDMKVMIVSASQRNAEESSKFMKQLIETMPLFQHLRPRMNQRDSLIAFDVGPASPSKDPSVKVAGITGQITGSRADLIIPDDIEIPKNSLSHQMREKLSDQIKEMGASILKPGGRVVYLGTPQVEETVYNRLPDRGYQIYVWPAQIPEDIDRYHGRLAPYVMRMIERGAKPFDACDPVWRNLADLADRRVEYGEAGYALQFMLDTSPASSEKHPLKAKNLIVHDVDDEMAPLKLVWGQDKNLIIQDLYCGGLQGDRYHGPAWKSDQMAKFTGTVMFIDPSGRGNDETAYAIVRNLYGLLFLVAIGGYRAGFAEETLQALAAKAARYKVNDIIIEENYGGGMFAQLLKPYVYKLSAQTDEEKKLAHRCNIEEVWNSKQKEARICDTLEPILSAHRLVVDRRVIEEDLKQQREDQQYSFIYQLTRMSRIKGALGHEDRVEALSGACGWFVDRMAADQTSVLEQQKQEALERELRGWNEHVVRPVLESQLNGPGSETYLTWQ